MTKRKKFFVSKLLAIGLSIFLFYGDFNLNTHSAAAAGGSPGQAAGNRESLQKLFNEALEKYNEGWYKLASWKLEEILMKQEKAAPLLKAKTYLLLGACFDNLGENDKTKNCFLQLKKMLEAGVISRVPEIPGLEPESMSSYREIMGLGTTPKTEKEPKDKVIYAAPEVREIKVERIKRKFPWRWVIGTAILAAIVTTVILTVKKGVQETYIPEIVWNYVPAGDYLMGDNFNEGEPDELPVHKIYTNEYYISRNEITVGEYNSFCHVTGRKSPFTEDDLPEHPAHKVSWKDANAFCDWLSAETGEIILLPTEAQWERAARGNMHYRYPWGNKEVKGIDVVWFGNWGMDKFYLTVVGAHLSGRSPSGLNDMAGNVAEWCRDWYDASYYSVSPYNNPKGPDSGSFRVVRGGHCMSDLDGIRSANRNFENPNKRSPFIGFRVVKIVQAR